MFRNSGVVRWRLAVAEGHCVPQLRAPHFLFSTTTEFASIPKSFERESGSLNNAPLFQFYESGSASSHEMIRRSRSSSRYRTGSATDIRKCFASVILERPRVIVPEFAKAYPEELRYLLSASSAAQAKALRPLNEAFIKRKPAAGDMFAEAAASKNTQLMMAARWKAAPRKTVADERMRNRKEDAHLGWRRSLSRALQEPTYLVVQDRDGTARFPRARLRHTFNESMRECAGRALAGISPVGGSREAAEANRIKGEKDPIEVHWVGHAPRGYLRARAPGKATFFYWAKYISGGQFRVPKGLMPIKPMTGPDYAWLTREELLDPSVIPSSKMRVLISEMLPY